MATGFLRKLTSVFATWHSYRSVIAVVLIGIILTLLATSFQLEHTKQQQANNLSLRATDEAARIQQSVNIVVEVVSSIGNFYAASTYVDRNEFRLFVHSQILHHPEIRALEWAPHVEHPERARIENELAQVVPGRGITERNAQNKLVTATQRKEYFPVFYLEPMAENESALGFDLASSASLSRAIQHAISTGKITFSEKIQLIQGDGSANGILVFQPIYHPNTSADTTSAQQKSLVGIAVAVIEPKELILASARNFNPTGLDVLLVDQSDHDLPEILYFHPSRSRQTTIPAPGLVEFLASPHYQVPIQIPAGQWVLYFRPAPAFIEEHHSALGWLILIIGIALTSLVAIIFARRKRHLQELVWQAQHDALTGLPNRSLLQDRLNQALTHANYAFTTTAVLFLDLDNFKHINDSLGHAIGDQLLIEVARRLRENARKQDTIARMGGDEFILLAQHLRQDQEAAQLARKLLQDLTSPYQIGERAFYLSASIGISLFPRDAMNTEALIANADAAMYRAKSRGRNTYEFYSLDLTTTSMKRMQLEVELRQAVKRGALDVYYQPQIELPTGAIIGAEALARWTHEQHGAISPQRFIPVAEESGLIVEIGEWVLRRACRQAKAWLDNGMPLRSMAVNVSGIQLQRPDFVSIVKQVLHDTGLPAQHLELELTESIIMAQAEQAIDTLLDLGKLGVTLAIDDFGTGHSSLAYLKRLPLDKLKIDRSFVRDVPHDDEDVAITGAIIALSSSLGLRVTAEGVETREQRDFLLQLGCDEAQGYLYSAAVPPQDFPQSVKK